MKQTEVADTVVDAMRSVISTKQLLRKSVYRSLCLPVSFSVCPPVLPSLRLPVYTIHMNVYIELRMRLD